VLSISWDLLSAEEFIDLADYYDVYCDGDKHAVVIIGGR